MKNLENLDPTNNSGEDMRVSGENTTDQHIRKSTRLYAHHDTQNTKIDKENGKSQIHNMGDKDTTNDLELLRNKLFDFMKRKKLSKKKAKQRLPHKQR